MDREHCRMRPKMLLCTKYCFRYLCGKNAHAQNTPSCIPVIGQLFEWDCLGKLRGRSNNGNEEV